MTWVALVSLSNFAAIFVAVKNSRSLLTNCLTWFMFWKNVNRLQHRFQNGNPKRSAYTCVLRNHIEERGMVIESKGTIEMCSILCIADFARLWPRQLRLHIVNVCSHAGICGLLGLPGAGGTISANETAKRIQRKVCRSFVIASIV